MEQIIVSGRVLNTPEFDTRSQHRNLITFRLKGPITGHHYQVFQWIDKSQRMSDYLTLGSEVEVVGTPSLGIVHLGDGRPSRMLTINAKELTIVRSTNKELAV